MPGRVELGCEGASGCQGEAAPCAQVALGPGCGLSRRGGLAEAGGGHRLGARALMRPHAEGPPRSRARAGGVPRAPFGHFMRPNFFPKPEKASEAWLAVLSAVSWVALATWSMAGEERRGQVRAVANRPGRVSFQEAGWAAGLQRKECAGSAHPPALCPALSAHPPAHCPARLQPPASDLSAQPLLPDPPLVGLLLPSQTLKRRDLPLAPVEAPWTTETHIATPRPPICSLE